MLSPWVEPFTKGLGGQNQKPQTRTEKHAHVRHLEPFTKALY